MGNSTCSTQSSIWVPFALCAMRKMQAAKEMRRKEAGTEVQCIVRFALSSACLLACSNYQCQHLLCRSKPKQRRFCSDSSRLAKQRIFCGGCLVWAIMCAG